MFRKQDSIAGIATGYGLDDHEVGVRVPVGSRTSLLHVVWTVSGATILLSNGHGGLFPWR
jgi:hypothetical protein